MDRLKVNDIDRIKALALDAQYPQATINHIDIFKKSLFQESADTSRELTDSEVKQLSSNQDVKNLMIILFLVQNVALEHLRKKDEPYTGNIVSINDLWDDIKDILNKKLLLSRELNASFKEKGGENSEEFKNIIAALKEVKINDLCSEQFVSEKSGDAAIRLYITGKYEEQGSKSVDKTERTVQEKFILQDRKTCCHVGLYDPFKFEEPQTFIAFRYLNKSINKKNINFLLTLKFSFPELTVLFDDGTFKKVFCDEIPGFIETNLKTKEIDEGLANAIKKDYHQLFQPALDIDTVKKIAQTILHLLEDALEVARRKSKPLLIVLSEVHGSKGSFLLHVIILSAANKLGINHLFAETINIYHKKWGWDSLVDPMLRLLSFAKMDLGIQVKDLEERLHFNHMLSPYPYFEIPKEAFGIPIREASWIADVKNIRENGTLIIGSGHMNSILNSELKEIFHMLPIDCSCDREYSDMLSISQHNFISLDKSLIHVNFDEIINMVKN